MISSIRLIAFDADDTLWHNERIYRDAQERWTQLLIKYIPLDNYDAYLFQTELQNITDFGFGIKSFTLSMIQAAIELTQGRIKGDDILEIVSIAKQMLDTPTELLEGVRDTVVELSSSFPLMIITKGDLLDQQRKLERSGLADYFEWVEIVSDKTEKVYSRLLETHNLKSHQFVMVGNSLRSDILPVIAIGGHAIYIPYEMTWEHELLVDHFENQGSYHEISSINKLPSLITQIDQ